MLLHKALRVLKAHWQTFDSYTGVKPPPQTPITPLYWWPSPANELFWNTQLEQEWWGIPVTTVLGAEAGESGQSHLCLGSNFEGRLSSVRPCHLKKNSVIISKLLSATVTLLQCHGSAWDHASSSVTSLKSFLVAVYVISLSKSSCIEGHLPCPSLL